MRRVPRKVASISGLNLLKTHCDLEQVVKNSPKQSKRRQLFAVAKPLRNFLPLFKSLITNGIQGAASHRLIGIVPASCSLMRGWNRVRKLRTSGRWCSPVLRVSVARCPLQFQLGRGETLILRAQIERKAEEIPIRHRKGKGPSTTGRVVFLLFFPFLAICLFALASWGKQPNTGGARVEGTVFVQDSAGNQSFVAGASVKFSGPATFETESDENGRYVIAAVPSGTYSVEAIFPGLKAVREVHVEDSEVRLPLELKPMQVTTSVVVTPDTAETKDPARAETISEKTLRDAPNVNERFESSLPLIPGVVRGPDGHVNLKGTRSTQSGALVNSANVTDPVTGGPALNLPIDVVASVQVISNPYDPQYGKFTGAVSTVSTKTSDYAKFHFSIQNFLPRLRDRDGSIMGIGAPTPRTTITGPLWKDHIAITQSFEYRFVRTPVNSLPPSQRDTKLESFDSYTQIDFILSPKQTAAVSVAVYPQKLDYLGLSTFTPQPSTPDFHQRGEQINAQDHYVIGQAGLLNLQFSYKRFDADITAQSNDPYRLLLETTEGGFFNRQARRTSRTSLQETYQLAPWQFAGSHQFAVGLIYEHSAYQGRQRFLPVEIDGALNEPVERISFTSPTLFRISQNETASLAGFMTASRSRLPRSLIFRIALSLWSTRTAWRLVLCPIRTK